MNVTGGEYDLVIRGGLVADASGCEPFLADVAVRSERIAAVGKINGSRKRRSTPVASR